MNWRKNLPLLFASGAGLVALHQYLNWGVWFELGDVHHELFIAMFLFAAVILVFVEVKKH